MPSRRPYIPPDPEGPPTRLSRAERRERRRKADEAGHRVVARSAPVVPMAPAERRALKASLAGGHTAFQLVLAEPCHDHDARPHQPCWDIPRGLCGARVARCLARDARARAKSPGRPRQPLYNGAAVASAALQAVR